MTKEFLDEHTMDEAGAQFDLEMNEFAEKVNQMTDIAELEALEQEVMKDQDKVNDILRTVEYELPAGVDFDGEHYTIKDIAQKIIYFLNKKEVEWKYTLGLFQLVKFWKQNNPTSIAYGHYDSTLRLLNQVQFKGYSEWRDILTVNEYLSSAHNAYSKDTSWLIFESERQNCIVNRIQQLQQLNSAVGGPDSAE